MEKDHKNWAKYVVVLIISGKRCTLKDKECQQLKNFSKHLLVFSGFIIFDTHMIMHRLSPEEYIVATIELYLDIINLFIEILKILDKINRKWTVQPDILFSG